MVASEEWVLQAREARLPAVSSVSPSGISYIDWLEGGLKWASGNLTYSFPTSASFYGSGYGSGEQNNNFMAFNAVQQAATTSILNMSSQVANVTFTQITETSAQSANLRYAGSGQPSTAWGYCPSTWPEGGDAWFNSTGSWYTNPVLGNYGYLTIIHETGHLLGLKHPQEVSGSFGAAPVAADSLEYTVMSYRSYIGASTTQGLTNATWSFPQTLMMYDIAALQYMYGANYTTNNTDTVYKWNPATGQETINGVAQMVPGGNTILMTIWDGGGSDTYDFSNYTTNLTVNLQPGSWTTTSTAQLANLGAGHTAIGNIANAYLFNNNPASLIENAVGGIGSDSLTGNELANVLNGSAGNDILYGNSGNDALIGGAGNDLLLGGTGNDTMTGGIGNDVYWLNETGDIIVENVGEGTDAANVFVSGYTLADNVEDGWLVSAGGGTLTGNELANVLNGSAGNDILYGNSGSDALIGGAGNDLLLGGTGNDNMTGSIGNDVYWLNEIGDIIVENVGEGTDAVNVFVSGYTLADNVEDGWLVSAGGGTLTGNDLANVLNGGSGADVLNGAGGNDPLSGYGGNDTFVFVSGQANGDVVLDFAGNGAAAGDSFRFEGFGTVAQGAAFTQLDGTNQWQIHSGLDGHDEIITLKNGAAVHASDFIFY
jgi:serralysin